MALTKIPSNLITLDAIDGTLIADDAIDSEHIANGAIDAAHMSANSIDSDSYVDGSIDTVHIGDDQVTAAKLANSINTSISDKLPLAGGTMTGALIVTDGSTSAPSIGNSGDTNSGIYFPADDALGLVVGGSRKLLASSTGITINNGNLDLDGNQLILDADADTSIRESADDYLIMKVGGTDLIKIDASGLGIGIRPAEMLDIQSASGDARIRLDAPSGSDTEVKFFNAGSAQYTIGHDDATDNFVIGSANVDTAFVSVDKSGKVGIDDTTPEVLLSLGGDAGEKLHVYHGGNVRAGFGVDMSGSSRELSIFHSTTGTNGNISFGERLESNGAYTENMRIQGDGKVGFGVTSPVAALDLQSDGYGTWPFYVRRSANGAQLAGIYESSVGDGGHGMLYLMDGGGTTDVKLSTNGPSYFNGGDLLIGTTSNTLSGTDTGFVFKEDGNASFVTGTGVMYMRRTTSDSVHIKFRSTTNASVGQISSDGSNTTYSTSSDYRLKENVIYDWDATTRLKQLKPARFNFLQGNTETQDGFLAHEVQTIVPTAVDGIKDAVDENGDIDPQSIDHSQLVPLLVKTIQEQQILIESLEARIATLEG